ncbi:MAG: amylo-alpha-1,6-glucosidase [Bryobacteraceae bacterium]
MKLPIELDAPICKNLAEASSREWLETNDIGGFASSSIIGLNTRRYHALLDAAIHPPVGRFVLLSKVEETLVLNGQRFDLGANQYTGTTYPQGYLLLDSFRLDPFPVFTYRVQDIAIEKSVFLVQGENTVVIRYKLLGDLASRSCELEVRPLIAFRDYHSTTHANDGIRRDVDQSPGMATVTPYPGLPSLHFAHDAESVDPSGFWFYNFEYEIERERGLDFIEDLYSPFLLRFNLARNPAGSVIASTASHEISEALPLQNQETQRRAKVAGAAPAGDAFARLLTAAADQFLVARGAQKTVIAGYPWFGDWGRDTMISLPGLTLVTGRFEDARNLLRAFARSIDQGMLPNRFLEVGEAPEYNTVDATLWMFHAVSELLHYSRDYDFVRSEMYAPLADIIAWHERGTRYGIHAESDGLLHAGEPGVQLTWMDSKIGDWVVTPRTGKPVEIQALWYNALRVMEHLAREFGDGEKSKHYAEIADRARSRFAQLFWNQADGGLFDCVTNGQGDRSIRPNQIFAVSLPYPLLSDDQALRVVEVVEKELLTPYGLRSLSPRDPAYKPHYGGNGFSRDSAYHQGTVWPWLIGPFLTAYVKVHGGSEQARRRADEFLNPLRDHMSQAGLGHISEVFDADPPHHPGGCFAQAWNVAEILRAYMEDVKGKTAGEERGRSTGV